MNPVGTNLEEIMDRYPGEPEYLIFLLQDIQSSYGYISPESMQRVCDRTGVPLTRAYSVATFYQSFRLDPKGEHEIKVCLGTACHLKGGQRLVDELERRLHVEAGGTTEDMRFTLNTVNCLGACAISPVMVVDDEYHPSMSVKKMDRELKRLRHEGEKEVGNV